MHYALCIFTLLYFTSSAERLLLQALKWLLGLRTGSCGMGDLHSPLILFFVLIVFLLLPFISIITSPPHYFYLVSSLLPPLYSSSFPASPHYHIMFICFPLPPSYFMHLPTYYSHLLSLLLLLHIIFIFFPLSSSLLYSPSFPSPPPCHIHLRSPPLPLVFATVATAIAMGYPHRFISITINAVAAESQAVPPAPHRQHADGPQRRDDADDGTLRARAAHTRTYARTRARTHANTGISPPSRRRRRRPLSRSGRGPAQPAEVKIGRRSVCASVCVELGHKRREPPAACIIIITTIIII